MRYTGYIELCRNVVPETAIIIDGSSCGLKNTGSVIHLQPTVTDLYRVLLIELYTKLTLYYGYSNSPYYGQLVDVNRLMVLMGKYKHN